MISCRTSIIFSCLLSLLVGGCATQTDIFPPKAVNSPILDYPPEAILERQSGTLFVLLYVDKDGSTSAFKIKHSTGIPILDSAGLDFVKQLEFLPAVIRGKKEACWAEQTVVFKLEKEPLLPDEWRDTARGLIHDLQKAAPEQRAAIQQDLYEQCTDYMSSVITRPDLLMNRLALGLVVAPVREKWAPYAATFPMSFLMFADFVAREPDPSLKAGALNQLRQSVGVDIRRIDQELARTSDARLSKLREALVAYLGQLDQSNE